jgi:peroxiredoxin
MSVATVSAEAGRSFVPENSPLLKYREALSFRDSKIADALGKERNVPGLSVTMPSHWGHYEQINVGMKSAKELPIETLKVNDAAVGCQVLEVIYDKEGWSREEQAVKYWIDTKQLLVVREEFAELQGRRQNSVLWHWAYQVDSVKLNQPPPEWLIKISTTNGDHPRPDWVGRSAPDFNLLDLDGRPVRLSIMRGKVLILDFWATWCGPCIEEMPTLEKIREEYKSRGVEVWAISDEDPPTVKMWLARHERKLQTLIDPDGKISEQYQVEGIPALVVIGRNGKILSYYTGNQSEQSLRYAIDMALSESQKDLTN